MNIIGTGLSGLVGSRVVELLGHEHSFQNLSLETGIDITKPGVAASFIESSSAPWVLHFAAKTDVDGAEREKELGEKSSTWIVNVGATRNLVDACRKTGKRLLYVSTDFVFDGTKEFYTENDLPNPQGWYALTKYEGEKLVSQLPGGLIIRIANPYRGAGGIRPDFVQKIIDRLQGGQRVVAPHDQLFVPTFIDDIARAIGRLLKENAKGVYHVVGTGAISPYQAAQAIASVFGFDQALVGSTTFAEYFQGRAPRPMRAVLKNDKMAKLGVSLATFEEGLSTIKHQRAKENSQ